MTKMKNRNFNSMSEQELREVIAIGSMAENFIKSEFWKNHLFPHLKDQEDLKKEGMIFSPTPGVTAAETGLGCAYNSGAISAIKSIIHFPSFLIQDKEEAERILESKKEGKIIGGIKKMNRYFKTAACALFIFSASAMAKEGTTVYETATSSMVTVGLSLSTTTPSIISRTPEQSLVGNGQSITWYSLTVCNYDVNKMVYGFSNSTTTAPVPALSCSTYDNAPVGAGTATNPSCVTEQFSNGMYMWGLACTSANSTASAIHRGR